MSGLQTPPVVKNPFNCAVLANGLCLVREQDSDLVRRLMADDKRDKVHPVPKTVDEFIAFRVGGLDETRQTWVQLTENGDIAAALYTARFDDPVFKSAHLPGNVGQILSTPRQAAIEANPASIIFYSISSFGRGAGTSLIYAAHAHMKDCFERGPWFSTLSPLRAPSHPKIPAENTNFAHWLRAQDTYTQGLKVNIMLLKQEALRYLSENRHVVQKFHLGNGAYIGDIKINANDIGSRDDTDALNVMVNYVYEGDEKLPSLQERKEAYKRDNLLFMSPYLARQFDPKMTRAFTI